MWAYWEFLKNAICYNFCGWKLHSIRGKFLYAQSSAWKYTPGIKVYLNYAKHFLHVFTFEGLTSDFKDETDARKEPDLHMQVHS